MKNGFANHYFIPNTKCALGNIKMENLQKEITLDINVKVKNVLRLQFAICVRNFMRFKVKLFFI